MTNSDGLPTTPHFLLTGQKPKVQRYRVFGCPAIFKRYDVTENGRRTRSKYNQLGTRGIFVGFPDDSAGWLFYVPSAKKTYISMDAVFDEHFTTPMHLPDLPYQGAIKLRGISGKTMDTDTDLEYTGPPSGEPESFPNNTNLPNPEINTSSDDDMEVHSEHSRRDETPQIQNDRLFSALMKMNSNIQTVDVTKAYQNHSPQTKEGIYDDSEHDNPEIIAYFANMHQNVGEISRMEYLNVAHEIENTKQKDDKAYDSKINLSDFIPEPRSLQQVMKLASFTKEKWGDAIRKEIQGLFDNDTFDTNEKALPADEVIPVKLALKVKLNAYGGLDKLKARICVRGDMQIKDGLNTWSPTASTRLLKCFMADAISNGTKIYQLDFIQAFIQSEARKRIFVILDKEYKTFCPSLTNHLGRPLKLKKCLYGADFSGKFWYDTLDEFLTTQINFTRSRVEGCLHIYRNGED